MKKEELSQLKYLKCEIQILKGRLKELEERATSCVSVLSGAPRSRRVRDYPAQIASLRSVLESRIKEVNQQQLQIEEFISKITDSELRLILELRYIHCLSWQKVAFKMGEQDESYPRRKHNSYLEKCQAMENEQIK